MQTTRAEADPASPASGTGQPPVSILAILEAITRLEDKVDQLQDVTQAVKEIRQTLGTNDNWKSAIIRSVKQWLSLVDEKHK